MYTTVRRSVTELVKQQRQLINLEHTYNTVEHTGIVAKNLSAVQEDRSPSLQINRNSACVTDRNFWNIALPTPHKAPDQENGPIFLFSIFTQINLQILLLVCWNLARNFQTKQRISIFTSVISILNKHYAPFWMARIFWKLHKNYCKWAVRC